MRKIFWICVMWLVFVPVSANDLTFEFFPELDLVPITIGNVTELELLDTWGRGLISDSAWTADGQYLRIASSLGVWQYDTSDWSAPPELLMDAPLYMDYSIFGYSDYTLSPDAETLFLSPATVTEASMPFDDTIAFNISTGELLRRTPYDANQVLSPDGTIVAHKNHKGYFHVSRFNRPTSSIHRLDKPIQYRDAYPRNEQPIAFSADNSVLVIRSDLRNSDDVHLIFTDLENNRREISHLVNFVEAKYSLNNRVVGALDQQRHYILLLNGETLHEIGMIHSEESIAGYHIHPNGNLLVTMTENNGINFYDLSSLEFIYSEQFDTTPWRKNDINMDFSRGGQYLIVTHNEGGAVWDTKSFELVLHFDDFNYFNWLFWSQNYPTELRRVQENVDSTIVASRDTQTDETIVRRLSLPAPDRDITHIGQFEKFMTDGSILYTGAVGYPSTQIISFPDLEVIENYDTSSVTNIEYHPFEPWVITNGRSMINIWDKTKEEYIHPWSLYPDCSNTNGCWHPYGTFDLSSDGSTIVYSDGVHGHPFFVHLYRSGDDEPYATLPDVYYPHLLFSPNDKWVGMTSHSGRYLYLWDVDNPQNLIQLKSYENAGGYDVFSLSFSDDSSMLIASTSYGVEFWDTESHTLLHTLPRSVSQPMVMKDNVLVTYDRGIVRFWGVQSDN